MRPDRSTGIATRGRMFPMRTRDVVRLVVLPIVALVVIAAIAAALLWRGAR